MAIKKNLNKLPLSITLIIFLLFVFVPLFSAAEYTFKTSVKAHYSLDNYRWVFTQPEFGYYIVRSLLLSAGAIIISLIVLVPLQIWLHISETKIRQVVDVVSLFPLIIPVVVYAIGAQIAIPLRLQDSVLELPFLYAMLALPYTFRALDIGINAIPLKIYYEAAISAGANSFKTITIVVFPAIRSALLGAIALCFALSIGEFTITSLLHWDTFPTWINDVSQGNVLGAITLSVISLIIPIFLLVFITAFLPKNEERSKMAEVELKLEGLSRHFKDVKALDDFNLEVRKGELISLLGPSGCGKTTALRLIAGLDIQDSGNIYVSGKNISQTPANKRNMGMVFQAYSLFPNLTAEENVAFGLQMRKVNKHDRIRRANELLELVGLPSHAKRFAHQLSGGQQQRVALARALAIQPDILLLDEPLSALDAQVRTQIREEIRRIQLDLGITTIFVTHDQEEAMAISDRVAVMNVGKLEQIDVPEVLYSHPSSSFVATFVGQVNKLPAKFNDDWTVSLLNSKLAISNKARTPNGHDVEALIRPESIQFDPNGSFDAEIVLKSFLGPISILGVSVPNLPLIHVHLDSNQAQSLQIGQMAKFKIVAKEVMIKN